MVESYCDNVIKLSEMIKSEANWKVKEWPKALEGELRKFWGCLEDVGEHKVVHGGGMRR